MFDLNEVQIVPTARHPINPVPNAVRCGVQEARRASCVPEARYRYTISCVPTARFFPLHSITSIVKTPRKNRSHPYETPPPFLGTLIRIV